MLVLGIDTSCDDTSASVLKDGRVILSNIVSSQSEIHSKYGGIVPELASRRHIEMIWPVVSEALEQAETALDEIEGIAVCYGPGLIGSLLVGCCFAKAIAYAKGIPLIGVNHLEGHLLSVLLNSPAPDFPFLSLIVSGGHTSLVRVDGVGRYKELGRTRDDAAGEAYDKVAKLLGLDYPGGPVIDRLAKEGNPEAVNFPRPYLHGSYDFSFSGLKTAVRNHIQSVKDRLEEERENIAASFQRAVIDVLVKKTEIAVKKEKIKRVALSGGVAANSELRERMKEMGESLGIEVYLPPLQLCTDNAAMIALTGYLHLMRKETSDLDLTAKAVLPIGT